MCEHIGAFPTCFFIREGPRFVDQMLICRMDMFMYRMSQIKVQAFGGVSNKKYVADIQN